MAGQTATFRVGASGPDPLFFQWRRNGDALAGSTNSALELMGVQPAQAGAYDVVVFNEGGSAASAVATLTVRVPASILIQPQGRAIGVGSNATFSVVAVGNGVLRYQWRFNGVDLAGATNASLVVTNVQLPKEGLYQVMVSDEIGTTLSLPARLTVLVRPVITAQPQGVTAVAGDTVRFSVSATGNPLPLSYRWRRNTVTLTNFVLYATNSVLTLTNVQSANAGTYSVVVTNLASSAVFSSNAVLTVLADSDGDHMPDSWETTYGLNPNDPADGVLDPDGDWVSNRDEYVSGTDPTNSLSYLKIETIAAGPGVTTASFLAVSNRSYSILVRNALDGETWAVHSSYEVRPTNRTVIVTDPGGGAPAILSAGHAGGLAVARQPGNACKRSFTPWRWRFCRAVG